MNTSRKGFRHIRSSWFVLVTIGLTVTGFTAGVLLVEQLPPAELSPISAPTSVPVVTQEFTDPVVVSALFVISEAIPLIVKANGTITSVSSGSTVLVSGKAALLIDEHPVLALHTTVPLFRDLRVGDRGRDVAALNTELTRLEYGKVSSNRYTEATAKAWAELLNDNGIKQEASQLSLIDVIWIPEETVTLQSWSASPGTSVRSGDVVGYARPKLLNIKLSIPESHLFQPGDRELTLCGLKTLVSDMAAPLSKEFFRELEATPDFANMVVNDQDTRQGVLALVDPLHTLRVPPGALFAVNEYNGCIQTGETAIPVRIVGAGLGATLVTASQSIDQVAISAGITMTSC